MSEKKELLERKIGGKKQNIGSAKQLGKLMLVKQAQTSIVILLHSLREH